MALSPFAFLLWQLRLEGAPFLYFHGVTLIFNSWELPRQEAGGQGLEMQVFGFRCRVLGSRKMPFFCRLETEFLLRAQKLRRFLIGRSAIRKCVSGDWESVNGRDAAPRVFRPVDSTVATAAIA
jgi:hypothetical protein